MRNSDPDEYFKQALHSEKEWMEVTMNSKLQEVASSLSPSGQLYFHDPYNPCWDLALITQREASAKVSSID